MKLLESGAVFMADAVIDDLHPELLRGACGVLHLLDCPGPLLLGVAADLGRDPVVGAVVKDVEHELADEVVRDRPALQPVTPQQVVPTTNAARSSSATSSGA